MGIPATMFVTTGRLDERFEYWWDILARVFDPESAGPPQLEIDLPGGRRLLSTRSVEERMSAYWDLYHALASMQRDMRDEVLARLVAWSGVPAVDSRNRRMSAAELQRLADIPGLTVGGHTVTHTRLPGLSYGVVRAEISRNKAALEAILQSPVSTFAYPFGAYDAAAIEAVRAARFAAAVTCDSGPVWGGSNPLALPRVDVCAVRERPLPSTLEALIGCGDASARRS
jgi:peptidoglycan/xylan/chitin deacetylase (PgdA/CDA1 family)